MSDIRLDLDMTAIEELAGKGRWAMDMAMRLTAAEVWANIAKEAPTDHGRLAGSFRMEPAGDLSYRISTNVHYALHVHEGTGIHGPDKRPYEILPKNKRALFWPGARHPVRRVLHPGIKGNPYVTRAFDKTTPRIPEFVEQALKASFQ